MATKTQTETTDTTEIVEATEIAEATETTKKSPEKCIHAGHRERLRERYDRSGMDDYADHEILELLLTYVIPRGDVNEQAHALVERFGSVAGVLDADAKEIAKIQGVGKKSALFLKMLPDVFRRYEMNKCDTDEPFDTVAKIGDYLHAKYKGVTVEKVYLILLNNSLKMIDCVSLGEGSVNCSNITIRRIAELALFNHAAAVVLAHNHPKGLAVPSGADVEITQTVESALETLGIPLLEHIIVTENRYAPIVRHSRGLLRASPATKETGAVDTEFYRRFYGEE